MAQLENVTGNDGWKVRIERLPYMDRVDFYIYRHVKGMVEILEQNGMGRRFAEGAAVSDVKPFWSMTNSHAKAIMVALAEAISEEGVHTPDAERLKGTLEAQSRHLEDMRTLLKLNKHRGGSK